VPPSFLNVGCYRGRYFLRDGYHRSFGFLSRGIKVVPAFVRDFASFEEMAIQPGMLPQDGYLGEQPPVIRDFLDEEVSTEVIVPVTQKLIIVQALELAAVAA
jgi:hypothetical protein